MEWLVSARGCQFFIGVFLKVHCYFIIDCTGTPLEGRWPHTCMTFKKVSLNAV